MLIAYGLPEQEKRVGKRFIHKLTHQNLDTDALIEFDPTPDEVDKIVESLANFNMSYNESMIMETFK